MRFLNRVALVYRLAAAEHRAEQADAKRRRAEKCALMVVVAAEQWRARHDRLWRAYTRLENAEIAARDALHHERGRKPSRPYVIRDDPKDAA